MRVEPGTHTPEPHSFYRAAWLPHAWHLMVQNDCWVSGWDVLIPASRKENARICPSQETATGGTYIQANIVYGGRAGLCLDSCLV